MSLSLSHILVKQHKAQVGSVAVRCLLHQLSSMPYAFKQNGGRGRGWHKSVFCLHSFIHSFIHFISFHFIHSIIHSFMHSFHSFIHSFIHLFIHSFIHSFMFLLASLSFFFIFLFLAVMLITLHLISCTMLYSLISLPVFHFFLLFLSGFGYFAFAFFAPDRHYILFP